MSWKTRGSDIELSFVRWITTADILIIPALENKKIPSSTFTNAKTIITIDWSKSFASKNMNKRVFPKLTDVIQLDSSKVDYSRTDLKIIKGLENIFIKDTGILWNNTVVNKEWLETQYHEYICAMYAFNKLRENELR